MQVRGWLSEIIRSLDFARDDILGDCYVNIFEIATPRESGLVIPEADPPLADNDRCHIKNSTF